MENDFAHYLIDRDFVLTHDGIETLRPVLWSVNIYEGLREYEASLSRFRRPQRLALAVFWYQAEVNNGGHSQFFWNSTGIVWKDTLAGLEMFGLPAHVALLREALEVMGGAPSFEREPRQVLADERADDFNDLDQRFFALERARSLLTVLTNWMHAHPEDFTFEGVVAEP